MGLIIYQAKLIETRTDESVLTALLKQGFKVPFNCQQGICHSCLMRADQGSIPHSAQINLTEEQKQQGYFLACQCRSFSRLSVRPIDE